MIDREAIGSSFEDIRVFRKHLLELKKTADYGVATTISDFFSTSTCRDLLFHVQEHRMNLRILSNFFHDHDLNFIGFEMNQSDIQGYKHYFPEDPSATNLDNWRQYEEENPHTFIGMYQFWIQKQY